MSFLYCMENGVKTLSRARIGLFGGSFNPIHNGHIAIGRWMLEHKHLDEVWFMVSPQNPLKVGRRCPSAEERFNIVAEALENEPRLVACDYELHLPKPSYTWNTLKHLSEDYPQNDFILLMGGDNWKRFERWWHWKDIIWQYETGIFPRNGEIPVSSTMIREMLAKGEDISPYVPKTVVRHYQTSCLP